MRAWSLPSAGPPLVEPDRAAVGSRRIVAIAVDAGGPAVVVRRSHGEHMAVVIQPDVPAEAVRNIARIGFHESTQAPASRAAVVDGHGPRDHLSSLNGWKYGTATDQGVGRDSDGDDLAVATDVRITRAPLEGCERGILDPTTGLAAIDLGPVSGVRAVPQQHALTGGVDGGLLTQTAGQPRRFHVLQRRHGDRREYLRVEEEIGAGEAGTHDVPGVAEIAGAAIPPLRVVERGCRNRRRMHELIAAVVQVLVYLEHAIATHVAVLVVPDDQRPAGRVQLHVGAEHVPDGLPGDPLRLAPRSEERRVGYGRGTWC